MMEESRYKKTVIKTIERHMRVLNSLVLFIVFSLLLLLLRFLYEFLSYVSQPSLVAVLSIVAGLVVIGMYIANAASRTAIKTIEEYTAKLDSLLDTTRDIREILHGDILLDHIMDSSLKLTGAEAGSIMLVEGDSLVFKIVRGSESSKLLKYSIPKSRGIAGWVAGNGSTVRVNDVKNDSRFDTETDKLIGYDTKSVLCVPLRLSSGIIGVLELVNKKGGSFTQDDEDLISYFADQAAIGIDRAKFFEDQKNYEIHLTDILVDSMENHITEKRGHSKKVARYSLLMARAINMPEDEKKRLYRACMLHDIGFLKIRLRDVKSAAEYKAHSQLAHDMLRPINFYADIAPLVLHHHERYDGKGYPIGLIGEKIPLESRMIAIAEAFDAMVSKDSYKYVGNPAGRSAASVYDFRAAIKELKNNAGTQFDPELVDIFVNNIDESFLEEV